jgi:hypothetical protein
VGRKSSGTLVKDKITSLRHDGIINGRQYVCQDTAAIRMAIPSSMKRSVDAYRTDLSPSKDEFMGPLFGVFCYP